MRINAINTGFCQNKPSFKRVIPINYSPTPKASPIKGIDPALMEISDILNSNEPFVYSKEESEKIREFFRQKIDDYNGKNGIIITKAGNKTFLISGDDADEIRLFQKKTAETVKKIKKSKNPSAERKTAISKARYKFANEILKRSESGAAGKPDSCFTFNRDDKDKLKFDSIAYFYKYFNLEVPEKIHHESSGKTFTAHRTAIFESDSIEI